ncbi:MAG: (d)CMP kinase [Rickettsiales bacterium]|jgi:cytidylate kinase|nr:(d)CMP kinase [Rickettsiales bacterium]
MNKKIVIAIDGTAASGKGFISKSISKILCFPSLDTGSLYRACTLRVLEKFFYPTICGDEKECEKIQIEWSSFGPEQIQKIISQISEFEITQEVKTFRDTGDLYKYTNNDLIRGQLVSLAVPFVAKIPDVRILMHAYQHNFAENPPAFLGIDSLQIRGSIIEGRDIGTRVFPNADLKLFISATVEVRAMRRFKDYEKLPDNKTTYEEVLQTLRARDEQDMNRSVSPLVPADDAIIIDTTDMNKEQVLECITKIITDKFGTDFIK